MDTDEKTYLADRCFDITGMLQERKDDDDAPAEGGQDEALGPAETEAGGAVIRSRGVPEGETGAADGEKDDAGEPAEELSCGEQDDAEVINGGQEDSGMIGSNRARVALIRHEVFVYGGDIIRSDRFEKARTVSHHIKYTVAVHSVEVAMYALLLARWLNRHHITHKVNERDLVRAALLHDIGMTEDSVHSSPSYRRAFSHPKEGNRIARDEFHLNQIQLNAIRRHMWPIGIIPPRHVIGWILTVADNMSSFNEGLNMLKARMRRNRRKNSGGR